MVFTDVENKGFSEKSSFIFFLGDTLSIVADTVPMFVFLRKQIVKDHFTGVWDK